MGSLHTLGTTFRVAFTDSIISCKLEGSWKR